MIDLCPPPTCSIGAGRKSRPSPQSQYLGVTSVPLPLPPAAPPSEAQLVAARELEERQRSMEQVQASGYIGMCSLPADGMHRCRSL